MLLGLVAMPCKKTISFCGLFLISGGYSFAQPVTTTEDAAQSSDTMVVSTSRSEKSVWESPASVHVIGADELGKSTSESLADVLRDVPGVEVSDNSLAGRKQIRIRGEDGFDPIYPDVFALLRLR
ncbi:TonB-dependent receptor plug domain-containing protein [Gibbsiella quercinecans]|uniref:TonB-dependent receptor plug domain-containing protein n=1 Tax=Gibbsiella quercinecans TaxID=929813 RepID=UPI001E286232|nr:TonB-dependent receptor plug domain-containing protein [Gibbsiella quercinecans]